MIEHIFKATTKSAILIAAQYNILPHYSFMVQNQITMSLCLTIAIRLSGSAYYTESKQESPAIAD